MTSPFLCHCHQTLTRTVKGIIASSDTKRSVIHSQSRRILGITPSCATSRQACNLSRGDKQGGSYPEQDADSTGHANLAHAHHCHFIPGGLRRTTEQRGDQLLQDWGHFQCWGGRDEEREECSCLVKTVVTNTHTHTHTVTTEGNSPASRKWAACSNFINTAFETQHRYSEHRGITN